MTEYRYVLCYVLCKEEEGIRVLSVKGVEKGVFLIWGNSGLMFGSDKISDVFYFDHVAAFDNFGCLDIIRYVCRSGNVGNFGKVGIIGKVGNVGKVGKIGRAGCSGRVEISVVDGSIKNIIMVV